MELLWDGGTKVCSNCIGHITKMAAMPIYGKNLKKSSFPEPKGRWPWNLVCIIGPLSTTKSAQMMILGWPWPILRQGQIWSFMLLYGEKGKTMDYSETIVVYYLNLATDDWSDKKFLLTSKLCPLGSVCPLPQCYIPCILSWKNWYRIRLQRDFFETCNKWVKWSGISIDIKILSPGDCLPLLKEYIHVENHEKIV